MRKIHAALVVGALLVGSAAAANPMTDYQARPLYQLSVAGGVADFADDASRHLTLVGGMWDVRFLAGESQAFAAEFAYVGTANGVNNVMAQFAPNGTIIGSSLEAAFRLQVPSSVWQVRPFGFIGIGWQNYTLIEDNFRNPAAIASADNELVMPLGVGVQFDVTDHCALDARYTYRALFDEKFLFTNVNGVPGSGSQGMSQQMFSARIGYIF